MKTEADLIIPKIWEGKEICICVTEERAVFVYDEEQGKFIDTGETASIRGKQMKRKKKDEKPSCQGCEYLDYWNSGEPFCTKGIDKACISNGFKFKEEANNG